MPEIVFSGRFYAEEGSIFFHNAWKLPWYEALVAPLGGYLNIVATSATVLARHLVSIELAPYVTIIISLLFQLCPLILLLTSEEPWLNSRNTIVLALLLVITPPVSEEIWLNTLHSQFHLTLCAALILAFRPSTPKIELFRIALLLLGSLSGPGPALLLPLFLVRAVLDKSRGRALQASALALGVMVQLVWFYSAVSGRSYGMDPALFLGVMFTRQIVVPFLGHDQAVDITAKVLKGISSGNMPIWVPLVTCGAFATLASALLLRRRSDLFWLFTAGCVVVVFSYYGAFVLNFPKTNLLLPDFGPRYYYVPQAIFALVVLGLAATGKDAVSKVSWIVVIWFVVIGLHEYFWPSNYFYAHGPDWRQEVAQWRKDPNHILRQWPQGWLLQLPTKEDNIPPAADVVFLSVIWQGSPPRGSKLGGNVDLLERRRNNEIRIVGWALQDPSDRENRIIVVAGERLHVVSATRTSRPDVAAAMDDPALLRAGFDLRLVNTLSSANPSPIQVFSESGRYGLRQLRVPSL